MSAKTGASDLEVIDVTGQEATHGMFGITTIAYDPATGQVTSTSVDQNAIKKLANVQVTNPGISSVIGRHVGQNTLLAETRLAQSSFEQARALGFGISFKVVNYPMIRVGDLVNLQLATANNPYGGLYHVFSTSTDMTSGEACVTVKARRGELLATVASSNPLDPSSIAALPPATITGQSATGNQIPVGASATATSGPTVVVQPAR